MFTPDESYMGGPPLTKEQQLRADKETIKRVAVIMTVALREIASGKGDYGRDIVDPAEYRAIARKALRDVGL